MKRRKTKEATSLSCCDVLTVLCNCVVSSLRFHAANSAKLAPGKQEKIPRLKVAWKNFTR